MDKIAIDKLVRICLRECLQTTRLPSETAHTIHQLMHPPIRNLIYIFIEATEKTHLKTYSFSGKNSFYESDAR